MKNIMKLSLAALAATVITAGTISAGEPSNSHFEYRFNAHGDRFGLYVPDKPTTVAVYGDRQGVRQRGGMQNGRSEGRFEWRMTAHGYQGFYVPAK